MPRGPEIPEQPDHYIPVDQDMPCVNVYGWMSSDAVDRAMAVAGCIPCPFVIQCAYGALLRDEPTGVWGGLDLDAKAREAAARLEERRTLGRGWVPDPALCGTHQGYHAHWRHAHAPCAPCRSAHALRSAATRARLHPV